MSDHQIVGMDQHTHAVETSDSTTPKRPPGKINPVLVIGAICVLGGAVAFGIVPRISEKNLLTSRTAEINHESTPVSVVIAQPGPAVETFTLPGSTQPIQDAPIYARVSGYLSKRTANIGDLVKTGQLLALIDTPELDQQVLAAKSAVEQSAAALDNAKEAYDKAQADLVTSAANVRKATTDLEFYSTELGRYTGLAQQGAVSYEDRDSRIQAFRGGQATLDSLKSAEKSAHASVNSAKAAVHVAQAALSAAKAQRDQYEATRSFRVVTAPFNGIVTKRNVDAGALITSGSNTDNTLLFEVAQTDVLRVFVYVPEQYVPYINVGEKSALRFQAYKGREFIGTVSNISGGVDSDSRTLQVEIHVPNPKHELLPGMYTTVSFEAPAKVRMPSVPSTAVQTNESGSFAYIVDENNVVHKHKLLIARDLGGKLEIEQGVKSGDHVIINASDLIREGSVVVPTVEKIIDKSA